MKKKPTKKQEKPIAEMGDTETASLAHPGTSMGALPARKSEASEESARNLQMKQSQTGVLREDKSLCLYCELVIGDDCSKD